MAAVNRSLKEERSSHCVLYMCGTESYNYVLTWQTQVENEHYSTVSGLVILSLECFIEIIPDFLCPFMND